MSSVQLSRQDLLTNSSPALSQTPTENTPTQSKTKIFNWKGVAKTVLKVAVAILAFSAIAAGTGTLLKLGGERIISYCGSSSTVLASSCKYLGSVAVFAGEKLFLLGKTAFLCIAVPIYTVCWVVPKWAVTEGIPHLKTLAIKVYETALKPLGRLLFRAIKWTWNAVIIPIANNIAKAARWIIENLALAINKIYQHVIQPLGRILFRAIKWTWNAVIVPLANNIAKAARWIIENLALAINKIYQHVIQPLGRIIVQAAEWTWNAVIVPLANNIAKAARWIIENLTLAINKIYQHVIHPLSRIIVQAVEWTWNAIIIPSAKMVTSTAETLYQNILVPMGNGIATIAKWTWNAAIVPVFNGIAKASLIIKDEIIRVSIAIYNAVILPTGQFITASASKIVSAIHDVSSAIAQSVMDAFVRIASFFRAQPA